MKRFAPILALALSACAHAPTTTGLQSVVPDSYTVSTGWLAYQRGGTATEARQLALASANGHCAQLGRQIVVDAADDRSQAGNPYQGTVTANFRCLVAGDPALKAAPNLRLLPDVVIQDARKP